MADDKLSRFRILEKSRNQPASGQGAQSPSPSQSARFGALEKKAEPGAPAAGPPSLAERFGPAGGPPPRSLQDLQQAAEAPSGLELAQANPTDQPFVRCMRCEADNNAWSMSCGQCGTNLNSDEQRAFNERLWAQRRAEKQKEDEEIARAKAAQRVPALEPGAQRELAEKLAQEVSRSTRDRLEIDGMRDGFSSGGGLGFHSHGYGRNYLVAWLYERIPPGVRTALMVVALGVPLLLTCFQRTRAVGFVGFLFVGLLLLRLWLAV